MVKQLNLDTKIGEALTLAESIAAMDSTQAGLAHRIEELHRRVFRPTDGA